MQSLSVKSLQRKIEKVFLTYFGRTPLRQRLEDISKECTELTRFIDLRNLEEETGDLLASTLMLCNENGWDADKLVSATLEKIKRRQLQYQALGRKVSVALIGGAFNPVTNGHIKLAQFVLNSSKTFDEVWLVPCYGHMYGKQMATPEQRLEMCRMAVKVDGRIKVCDYEISHKLKGETYHFLKQLLSEDFAKDQYDFSYVIGLDNANTFDKWVNYEDLERMMRFVVVGRQGVKRDEKVNWYLKPPHIYLMPDKEDIPEVSSTQVREAVALAKYEDAAKLVDPSVYQYIVVDKQLYQH
jgi:nicotinate (nicotinamide) nucleotide adenylyltransferase